MINARRLLDDLKRLLKRLEDDLRQREASVEAMQTALQREYAAAKEAGHAGEIFEFWRESMLTQAGAAWLLSGVFVRFLEDNGLADEALLSGSGERREQASNRQMRYFQQHPTDSDRDYLYHVFHTVQTLSWEERLEWDATKLQSFPIPAGSPKAKVQLIDLLAKEYRSNLPNTIAQVATPSGEALSQSRSAAQETLERMIATQEELDWEC